MTAADIEAFPIGHEESLTGLPDFSRHRTVAGRDDCEKARTPQTSGPWMTSSYVQPMQ